jgi:hypothetical protein
MTTEREHLDQLAHELRADLRAAGRRLWRRLGKGEALAGVVDRHPLASAGGAVGVGFLAALLAKAALRHPRLVWRGARTVLRTMTSNALTPLVVMARGLGTPRGGRPDNGRAGAREAMAAKEAPAAP